MNILAPISEDVYKNKNHLNKSIEKAEKSKIIAIQHRAAPATVEKEKSTKLVGLTTSTKKVAPRKVEFLQASQSVLQSKS